MLSALPLRYPPTILPAFGGKTSNHTPLRPVFLAGGLNPTSQNVYFQAINTLMPPAVVTIGLDNIPLETLAKDAMRHVITLGLQSNTLAEFRLRQSTDYQSKHWMTQQIQISGDEDGQGRDPKLAQLAKQLAAYQTEIAAQTQDKESFSDLMTHRLGVSRNKGVGNCEDMAFHIAHYLQQHAPQVPVAIITLNTGDFQHVIAAIGLEPHARLTSPKSWNETAWILDPWLLSKPEHPKEYFKQFDHEVRQAYPSHWWPNYVPHHTANWFSPGNLLLR